MDVAVSATDEEQKTNATVERDHNVRTVQPEWPLQVQNFFMSLDIFFNQF